MIYSYLRTVPTGFATRAACLFTILMLPLLIVMGIVLYLLTGIGGFLKAVWSMLTFELPTVLVAFWRGVRTGKFTS